MSTPGPTDPFAAWRELLAQWEKNANVLGNQTLSTDQFGQSMSQVTSLSLAMQQMMGDMMTRAQAAANMPTRADIVAISERLQAIEQTLNRLAQAVDRLAAGDAAPGGATGRPARTRKPPGAQE
jgi:LPS O-antigen subunit length determinant protein (WzzB/FepE family)